MRRVLVTGGTGFTGRHVVPLLLTRGYEVTCFVRPTSDRSTVAMRGVRFAEGNIDSPESLERALSGCDALINLVYIDDCRNSQARRAHGIVRASCASGVTRAIFVSSTSIFTTLDAPAKAAKLAAEQVILNSGLNYTILRPTMIYGTSADRNIIRLARFLRKSPVMLVPGSGEFRLQPVHVEDLAKGIVDCLELSATFEKVYNLSGAQPLAFNELVDQTCDALGVKRVKLHMPLTPALWFVRLFPRLQKRIHLKEEQILRLNEDKCFDHSEAGRDFGFAPRSFAAGIRQEVSQLKN